MIQKESFLQPCDKTQISWVKTFHLYKGGMRKIAFLGNFIKVSVRVLKIESFLKKRSKTKALITTTKFRINKIDGSFNIFRRNGCVLIKRKLVFRSKLFFYPSSRKLRRKKIFYKFPGVL